MSFLEVMGVVGLIVAAVTLFLSAGWALSWLDELLADVKRASRGVDRHEQSIDDIQRRLVAIEAAELCRQKGK